MDYSYAAIIVWILWIYLSFDMSNMEMMCNKDVSRMLCMVPGFISFRSAWCAGTTLESRLLHALAGPNSPSKKQLFGINKPFSRIEMVNKNPVLNSTPGPFMSELLWQASEYNLKLITLSGDFLRKSTNRIGWTKSTIILYVTIMIYWAPLFFYFNPLSTMFLAASCLLNTMAFRYFEWDFSYFNNINKYQLNDALKVDVFYVQGKRIEIQYDKPATRLLAWIAGSDGHKCDRPNMCGCMLITGVVCLIISYLNVILTQSSEYNMLFVIIQFIPMYVLRLFICFLPGRSSIFENSWNVVRHNMMN